MATYIFKPSISFAHFNLTDGGVFGTFKFGPFFKAGSHVFRMASVAENICSWWRSWFFFS